MFTSVACGKKDEGIFASDDNDKVVESDDKERQKTKMQKRARKLHLLGPDKGGDIKFADGDKFQYGKRCKVIG